MSDWVEINLPWSVQSSLFDVETIDLPTFDKEVKNKFGNTIKELDEKYFPEFDKYEYLMDHPIRKAFDELENEIYLEYQKECKEKQINVSDEDKKAEINARLLATNDPCVPVVFEWREKVWEIEDWIESQPEYIAVTEQNNKIWDEHDAKQNALSFRGNGLAKPGTVIEFKDHENKLTQMMIGDINELGGSCDDCMGINRDTVILRYKVVWKRNQ